MSCVYDGVYMDGFTGRLADGTAVPGGLRGAPELECFEAHPLIIMFTGIPGPAHAAYSYVAT